MRIARMPPHLPAMLIPALAIVLGMAMVFGFPSLAIIAVRFFRFKERELQLEMEFRQSSQHNQAALEQRVQRLEEVLGRLDKDVRERLGIQGEPRRELFEGPAAAAEGGPAQERVTVKAR